MMIRVPGCCSDMCFSSIWRCILSWREGRSAPIIPSAVRTVYCRHCMPDLEAEPNQTVIEVNRTDSLMTVSLVTLSAVCLKVSDPLTDCAEHRELDHFVLKTFKDDGVE